MRLIVFALFTLCVVGCQESREDISQRISVAVKSQFESEYANRPLTTFEVRTVSYEEVGPGRLDTLQRVNIAEAINTYTEGKDMYDSLALTSQEDFSYYKEQAAAYRDSVDRYIKKDSLFRHRIAQRKENPKKYYLASVYIKSTTGSKSWSDTLKYALDKEFSIVKANDLAY